MRLWATLLLLALGAHHNHLSLLQKTAAYSAHLQNSPLILPSAAALKLLSLGYRNLLSDYFWLRSVADYGDKRDVSANHPNLWPLLSRAQALDPKFGAPYMFAGHVLTLKNMPWQQALVMLKEGMAQRPDLWSIAFLYGFNLYYMEQDYDGAARALAEAAKSLAAPPFLAPLAARLSVEAGEPQMGLTMVDSLLAQAPDPGMAEILVDRRRRLLLELDLRTLNRAAAAYRQTHGHPAAQLSDLLGTLGLQQLPIDPFGGSYIFDNATGLVHTRHPLERLRLQPHAKEKNRAGH